MELLRSLIFVPGNRENMLERAQGFAADVIMVDLEDSVPPGEKVNARGVARSWATRLVKPGRKVMVRCNALDTGLTRDEMAAVIGPGLYGFSVGKTESVWDLQEIDRIIGPLEASAGLEPGSVRVIPWIESAKAVLDARRWRWLLLGWRPSPLGPRTTPTIWEYSGPTTGKRCTCHAP